MNTQIITLDLDKKIEIEQYVVIGRGDHNGTTIGVRILDGGENIGSAGPWTYLKIRLTSGGTLSIQRSSYVSAKKATIFSVDERLITAPVDFAYVSIDTYESGRWHTYSTERFRIVMLEGSDG